MAVYSNGAALIGNTTPFSDLNNQFKVPSTSNLGDADYPFYEPSTSQWFKTVPNPTIAQPSYSDNCPGDGTSNRLLDTLQLLDERIALDSISSTDFEAQMKYLAGYDLIHKLRMHESLVNSDTIYSNFFDAKENSIADQLCLTKIAVGNLNTENQQTRTVIIASDSTLRSLLNQKVDLDSLLLTCEASADSAFITDQIINTQAQIASVMKECDTLLQSFYAEIENSIEDAADQNNTISTNTIIEQNEKDVNAILLEKVIFNNYNLSGAQVSLLNSIAAQCPFEGGRSVLKAWAILKSIGDSSWFDADIQCDTSGSPRLGKRSESNNYFVKVAPNPTTGNCIFSFSLPENSDGVLQLYNTLGQKVSIKTFKANSTSFEFQTDILTAGIYEFKLSANEQLIGAGKLIVIR